MSNGNKPNDQRSNVNNPNNTAKKASDDNRANQLNPNNPAGKPAAPDKKK
jgi:hypothetical protein